MKSRRRENRVSRSGRRKIVKFIARMERDRRKGRAVW
jgi:hypothetical protein